jgi:tripartite-type tricarboxylate transporter receptor subunit TctC
MDLLMKRSRIMARKITRRTAVAGLSALAAAPTFAQSARPEGIITIVHGATPGGNLDSSARIVADRLGAKLGQRIVVESKPGAGGTIATAAVARAAPDGATLLIAAGGHAVAAAVYNKLPYKVIEDFSWISMVSVFPFVFVTYPDHPIRDIPDLIRTAQAQEAKLLFATPGNGTGQHLALELFTTMAKIKVQHVPYRGSPQAATDLLGKRLDVFMDNPTVVADMVRDGRMRGLGVTGESRFVGLPNIPTIAESVPGYSVTSWLGLAGPAGIPAPLVAQLNSEMTAILQEPETIDKLRKLGNEVTSSSPKGFKSVVAADIERWTKVVADAGISRI